MPKKWGDDRQDQKLLKLYLYLLFSKQPIPRAVLIDRLNTSSQRIGDYVKKLEEMLGSDYGHLKKTKVGRQTYYSLERPNKSICMPLDPDGLRQMEICRDFMIGLFSEKDRNLIEQELFKIKTNLPQKYANYQSVQIANAVSKGHIDYTPFQNQIHELELAIINRECCEVTYKKNYYDEPKTFCIAPQKLVAYHESLNVYGWLITSSGHIMTEQHEPINLSIHRMLEVKIQKGRVADKLPIVDITGQRNFGYMKKDSFKVKILFSKNVATYVVERTWSPDQQLTFNDDKSVILEFTSQSKQEVKSFILGFGKNATILEPIELRDEIFEELHEIIDLYK